LINQTPTKDKSKAYIQDGFDESNPYKFIQFEAYESNPYKFIQFEAYESNPFILLR
jgi:hypothetical protein